MAHDEGCWWSTWERQDGRVFRAKAPEPTLRAASRTAFDSAWDHYLPVGGVRVEVLSHPTEGALLTVFVSDGDSYVLLDVDDVGELLLTAGVN